MINSFNNVPKDIRCGNEPEDVDEKMEHVVGPDKVESNG